MRYSKAINLCFNLLLKKVTRSTAFSTFSRWTRQRWCAFWKDMWGSVEKSNMTSNLKTIDFLENYVWIFKAKSSATTILKICQTKMNCWLNWEKILMRWSLSKQWQLRTSSSSNPGISQHRSLRHRKTSIFTMKSIFIPWSLASSLKTNSFLRWLLIKLRSVLLINSISSKRNMSTLKHNLSMILFLFHPKEVRAFPKDQSLISYLTQELKNTTILKCSQRAEK